MGGVRIYLLRCNICLYDIHGFTQKRKFCISGEKFTLRILSSFSIDFDMNYYYYYYCCNIFFLFIDIRYWFVRTENFFPSCLSSDPPTVFDPCKILYFAFSFVLPPYLSLSLSLSKCPTFHFHAITLLLLWLFINIEASFSNNKKVTFLFLYPQFYHSMIKLFLFIFIFCALAGCVCYLLRCIVLRYVFY